MEDLREGIKGLLDEAGWHIGDGIDDCAGNDEEAEERGISDLLKYLHSQGVVRKVNTPESFIPMGEQIRRKLECTVVEPLIEE